MEKLKKQLLFVLYCECEYIPDKGEEDGAVTSTTAFFSQLIRVHQFYQLNTSQQIYSLL